MGTISSRVSFFCVLAPCLICLPAHSQNATSTATPAASQTGPTGAETPATMPSDPKEMMLLAA
ncbi:MAG: hypothetical protein ABR907_16610 [Terracidiphilus sp.]